MLQTLCKNSEIIQSLLKALKKATCLKCEEYRKCFRKREILDLSSLKFSTHMNIFWQHILKNEKPACLACIHKHVSAVIVEFRQSLAEAFFAVPLRFPQYGFYYPS